MQGDRDSEFRNSIMGAGAGAVRQHDAELRVFVMRAATQIEQTVFPLMDWMLNDLQARIERSRTNSERQQLSDAFVALHKRKPALLAQFSKILRELIDKELAPAGSALKQAFEDVSIQGLALVDDEQMAEEIEAKRTAMKIETVAEWELREQTSFINSLQGLTEPDQQRNPLRPEVLSKALHRALQGSADDPIVRRLLENAIGDALATAMRECYRRIAEDLRRRNIKPLEYAAKASAGSGYIAGMDAGPALTRPMEQALLQEVTQEVHAQAALSLTQSLQSTMSAVFGMVARVGANTDGIPSPTDRSRYQGGMYEAADSSNESRGGAGGLSGPNSGRGPDSVAGWSSSFGASSQRGTSARLKDLLQDLRGSVWGAPTDVRSVSVRSARGFGDSGFADSTRHARSFASTEPHRPSAFGPISDGAMLNPVRAHLQQLQEATKEPYRLTIEVVALMFDAILADKLLQPLAARLIARLQLPLLDVALSDPDLFTRTTHPLHALVNRLGNAAAAFDVYETGPGQRFYAAALSIVEEILEGDFLSLETYRGALDKLNAFVKHEAQIDNPFHSDAAHVLAAKELSVHLEHHLSTQVTPLIQQMPIQAFLRDFFLQTWVRAQVEAVLRYGEKSPESHRYSRMCSDLVWSVQPKTTADDKRQLVAALPHLMRDVNEAFALLKWPALAQKEFRGRLIEHQARAMKGLGEDGEPIAEGYRSEEGERAIAALKSLAIPAMEELQARTIDPASLNADECAFTEAERNVTGFLRDDEVSEAALADVPLFEEPEQDSPDTEDESPTENEFPSLDGEIGQEKNRAMNSGEAFKVKIGGEWRKLRLAWVSDMRSFYLFDDCADVKHKFTFSSKTLARLWVDEEIHLFETESLMARAIAATRKSLLAPH